MKLVSVIFLRLLVVSVRLVSLYFNRLNNFSRVTSVFNLNNFVKIMKQICKFQPGRDIVQTVPGLQVNIPDSIDFHRIQDTSVPSQYNGQQSMEDVGIRIREPFDVIEYDRSYTRIRHNVLKEKSEKQSKGDK